MYMKKNAPLMLLAIIAFCSCKSPRYIYSASAPNNPFFTQKGDSKITGYYSVGGKDGLSRGEKNNGYDLQAAYAITNHVAITASVFKRNEFDLYKERSTTYNFDSLTVRYKRNLVEFGAGYFYAPNKSKWVTLNIYGGVGFGKFSFKDSRFLMGSFSGERFHEANITKWYIQPSINLIAGEYLKFGFLGRASYVHYSNISTDYPTNEEAYYFLDKIRGTTFVFIEPSFTMQLGLPKAKWVKFDCGFSTCLGRGGNTNPYSRTFNGFVGASFDIFKIGKK
jgi:hypothetical protein